MNTLETPKRLKKFKQFRPIGAHNFLYPLIFYTRLKNLSIPQMSPPLSVQQSNKLPSLRPFE